MKRRICLTISALLLTICGVVTLGDNTIYCKEEITKEVNETIIVKENNDKVECNTIEIEETKEETPKENQEVVEKDKNIKELELPIIEVEPISPITYTKEELDIMSHLIMGEAEGSSWEMKINVGSVVLNRVKDKRFPDSIKEVVFEKGQYACTWDGNYDKTPNQESVQAAIYLLENGSQLPEYVIFQAEFKQGDSTYEKVENTYFCYWSYDK